MVGTQRSGSNLLRVMLNNLDGVTAPHPPHIIDRLYPLLYKYNNSSSFAFKQLVEDAIKLIEVNPVPWEKVTLCSKSIVERCREESIFELFTQLYNSLAEQQESDLWICKSMANIKYAEDLLKLDSSLKFIYLYRDGRDVALSFKRAVVGEKHIYSIAKRWHASQQRCLKLVEELGEDRVIKVSYEELIENPESVLKIICDKIDINYSSKAMEFYQSRESKATATSGKLWENVTKPVMSNNSNKYKLGLTQREIEIFQQVAEESLISLGYSLDSDVESLNPITSEEIDSFTEENMILKDKFKKQVSEEDLAKRAPQDRLLEEILNRD